MVTMITGGARSGKSKFAEDLYRGKKDVVYIATSKIFDEEMKERIKLHQENRDSNWRTFEGNYDLYKAVEEEKYYLLDCITILCSNIMFDITENKEYIDFKLQREVEDTVIKEVEKLILEIKKHKGQLILVTNEVGYSVVPENHLSRVFRDIQGRINQRLGKLSDDVYLVCCGIPVKIK